MGTSSVPNLSRTDAVLARRIRRLVSPEASDEQVLTGASRVAIRAATLMNVGAVRTVVLAAVETLEPAAGPSQA